MVSKQKLEEALGRLSLLKWFPQNPHALIALAEILRELCPEDSDVTELVREVLNASDEWTGPANLRTVRAAIIQRHKAVEQERAWNQRRCGDLRRRDEHEAGCSGISVYVNDNDRTVDVRFCGATFGEPGSTPKGYYEYAPKCRKGDSLKQTDPGACVRRLADELAARPGWVSEEARWLRTLRAAGGAFHGGEHGCIAD